MKKFLAVLLAALMLLALVACGGNTDTSKAESTGDGDTSTDTSSDNSDAETVYKSLIPDGFEFYNDEYIILTTAFSLDNIQVTEFGCEDYEVESSVINDAIANRNLVVEQLTGVKIVERLIQDTGRTASGQMVTHIQTQVNGGSADFDLVAPSLYSAAAIAQQDLFYDLTSLDNMQLDSPWWDEFLVNEASIQGKLFFVTGDISTVSRSSLTAVYFNKETVAELELPDPYEMVRNRQWTLDTVLEWSKMISQDLNEDGQIDYRDRFGMGGQNDNAWAFFYGSGEKLASKDGDGNPIITIDTARAYNVADKIAAIMTNSDYFINANNFFNAEGANDAPATLLQKAFSEGRSLFFCENLGNVEGLRDMGFDFGILPTPLFDENQDRYYSLLNCWVSNAFAITTNLSPDEAELSAVIANALAAEGKNTVMPAYVETTLKGQRLRDDESEEMLDIIFANIGCDIGHIYDFGNLGSKVLHQIPSGGNFRTLVDTNKPAAEAAIEKLLDSFAAIN